MFEKAGAASAGGVGMVSGVPLSVLRSVCEW